MPRTILRRSVPKGVICLLMSALPSLCQCPALTGGGNFSPGATVQVWGVQDPVYGVPPLYPVAGALGNWAGALGSGIAVQLWLVPGASPSPANNVEVVWAHLGLIGPNATTSWDGEGSSVMEINVDKPFPAAQQQFYAHEAGFP